MGNRHEVSGPICFLALLCLQKAGHPSLQVLHGCLLLLPRVPEEGLSPASKEGVSHFLEQENGLEEKG